MLIILSKMTDFDRVWPDKIFFLSAGWRNCLNLVLKYVFRLALSIDSCCLRGHECGCNEAVFRLQAKNPLHSGSYEHSVPTIKNQNIFLCQGCLFVWFNIAIFHLGRPYATHTAPMLVLTDSVHEHILMKPSRAGFAQIRWELIEPGAETCVYQAKACSPTDQPVRKFKDGLGINMTMKTFLTYHIMWEA